MSFSKTQGLFTCCVALSMCLIYVTVTERGDVEVDYRHIARESDISSNSCGGCQKQREHNEFAMEREIKLGSSISNALYNLYVAKGRPVETSLFISHNQTMSIISIDDDDEYDDDSDDDDYNYDDDDDDDGYDDDVESDDKYSWKDTTDMGDAGSYVDDGQITPNSNISPEGKDDNFGGLVVGGEDDDGAWKNNLEGEKVFRYLWNEWDHLGWMKLPLAVRNQETKSGSAIVFNRVGKCGSRSVLTVLQKLSHQNRFYLVSSLTYNETKLSRTQEKNMVKVTSSLKRPNLFQRHVHFIDYTRHNLKQPLYINIIRDPLDRMVSQYYYVRFGDDRGPGHYKGNDQYQTFDECVLSGNDECLGPKSFYIIPYFCGQDFNCTKDRQWAFKKAVENLEKYYIVVGLLEELEDTFRVFERVLPYFFKGALEIYQSISGVNTTFQKNTISKSVTKHKIKPSPEVSKMMREHMKLEYTFYELVKKRFHEQMRRLGIV